MATPAVITDSELTDKIKSSHLDEKQKTELVGLVTSMTEDERVQLLNIIDESNVEVAKVENQYNKKLGDLNKEYTKKTDDLVREETKYARTEFEKYDNEQKAVDMRNLETEIATAPAVAPLYIPSSRPKTTHSFRNFILVLFALLALAGVILFAINSL